MTSEHEVVVALLARAGLRPSLEETDAIVAAHGRLRSGLDALYTLAEARYEAPALRFTADQLPPRWF
jgi:hypothetical protein